jgi:hypothetical protein
MNKNERQFQAANAAIERAVDRFVTDIDKIMVQREAVAPTYVREQALLILCDRLVKLIDDPILAVLNGPAMLKLSNALLDYRDSLPTERE